MNYAHTLQPSSRAPEFLNPTHGATQFGYREIAGTIPSVSEPVNLNAWAVVFADASAAEQRYREIVYELGWVDADGLATTIIEGMPADRIGSLSERGGLFGDVATIWVTAADDARGAILAALDESLLVVLALSAYEAEGDARAVTVIERLATAMAARQATLALPSFADTMSRLPILQDLEGLFEGASIRFNRYTVPQ